jgi:UDP-2,3-diacylglucosamine pyrophosphatase LpxH
MDYLKRLSRLQGRAKVLEIGDHSRLVLMSDCHRGDGGRADTFFRNRNVYLAALQHYDEQRYTYIELGDGDELWENRSLAAIVDAHADVFERISSLLRDGRFYALRGNHDMERTAGRYVPAPLRSLPRGRLITQFQLLTTYESIRLVHERTGRDILLVHGHQVDGLNSTWWRLARFLVRYLWHPLEAFGVNDPTSAAKNNVRGKETERRLLRWVSENRRMLIAGHTHRPVFPPAGTPPYFNDGSCVHPGCITAIEIDGGQIALVKWCVKVRADGVLHVGRDILAGPAPLAGWFDAAR